MKQNNDPPVYNGTFEYWWMQETVKFMCRLTLFHTIVDSLMLSFVVKYAEIM